VAPGRGFAGTSFALFAGDSRSTQKGFFDMPSKAPSKRKYSRKASQKVKSAMHEKKRGTLKSGRSGKKVKSRKQAIAIGLSEARRSGAKVPAKKKKKKP
jgi:Family of unknown function (DUF6496)